MPKTSSLIYVFSFCLSDGLYIRKQPQTNPRNIWILYQGECLFREALEMLDHTFVGCVSSRQWKNANNHVIVHSKINWLLNLLPLSLVVVARGCVSNQTLWHFGNLQCTVYAFTKFSLPIQPMKFALMHLNTFQSLKHFCWDVIWF